MDRATISSLMCVLALALACQKDAPPPATPAAAVDDQAAADAEAEQQAKAEAEEKEKAKQLAELNERVDAAIKRMEEEYAKEAQRWDAKLQKKVKKLVAKDYKTTAKALTAALKSKHREPKNPARDEYRHPKQTLAFFGLEPTMTVVEVSPGAGWYTELLAVVLHKNGKLVIPSFDAKSEHPGARYNGRGDELMLAKSADLFGKVERFINTNVEEVHFAEPGSADMVLVFRMMHNWQRSGKMKDNLAAAHDALKPGGVLAVIQHRAKPDAKAEDSANKGRLPEAWLIEIVEAAGFKLEGKSDVNANPKDTKDYEKGVWTLPPTYRLGDTDRDKYTAIGESDRMTLKFVKN